MPALHMDCMTGMTQFENARIKAYLFQTSKPHSFLSSHSVSFLSTYCAPGPELGSAGTAWGRGERPAGVGRDHSHLPLSFLELLCQSTAASVA